MKHITELIQKQIVKKHSRALMFYLFLLVAAAILAWISQSLYVSLFIVVFLAALAVRLIQAVHELGQVKRFTQSLRGPQRLLYRQVDTTFFLEDRWISWFNRQGVQGTYDEITMCSYAQVPLRKSEKLYAPCPGPQDNPDPAAARSRRSDRHGVFKNAESGNPVLGEARRTESAAGRSAGKNGVNL